MVLEFGNMVLPRGTVLTEDHILSVLHLAAANVGKNGMAAMDQLIEAIETRKTNFSPELTSSFANALKGVDRKYFIIDAKDLHGLANIERYLETLRLFQKALESASTRGEGASFRYFAESIEET